MWSSVAERGERADRRLARRAAPARARRRAARARRSSPGSARREHLEPLGGEHGDRRAVDLGVEHALHAPEQQPDAPRGAPLRRRALGQPASGAAARDGAGARPWRAAPALAAARSGRRAAGPRSAAAPAPAAAGGGGASRTASGAAARSTAGARVLALDLRARPARSAGRSARPTGTRSRTPCSPGSGRSA